MQIASTAIIIASTLTIFFGTTVEDTILNDEINNFKNVSVTFATYIQFQNANTSSLYMNISEENYSICLLSLHFLLALVYNGAEEGLTRDEINFLLINHLDMESMNKYYKAIITSLNAIENTDLHVANTVFIQDGIDLTDNFLIICMRFFKCTFSKIDFKNKHAAEFINTWVQQKTNNKISNIISPHDISEDTKIVLVNTIYFNNRWLNMVEEETKHKFYVSGNETYFVPTIRFSTSTDIIHGKIPPWDMEFIEIPFLNKNIVMTIFMTNGDIEMKNKIVSSFPFNWRKLAEQFSDKPEVHLPKFTIKIIRLKKILNNIIRGRDINTMFEYNANFSQLSSLPLKVSNILQTGFIQFNEEGFVKIGAEKMVKRVTKPLKKFVVDRLFCFLIEYKQLDEFFLLVYNKLFFSCITKQDIHNSLHSVLHKNDEL